MYQRDYLVRLIQEMTTLIGRTLGLKQQKEKKELLQNWEELLDRRFRMSGHLADSLSVDDLISIFHRHGHIQADELQAFSVILLERAELEHDVDLNEGNRELAEGLYIQRVMKSYELLLEAILNGSDRRLLDVMEHANRAAQVLRPYILPSSLLERLWRWHDEDGRYAEAENACYDWLHNDNIDKDSNQKRRVLVLAWYEELLSRSDEQLAEGGLSREEVEQAMEELKEVPGLSESDSS